MAITKVTNSVLADGSIHTANLADDAITAAKVADAAIDSAHIGTGAIDTAHIADANITTAKLADSAITTVKIAADAVDGTKIADDSIDSEHIAADSIDAEHYAPGSVDSTALADDAVTIAKIADAAIVTEAEGIGSNDNDTTLPTSAAVVDYVANNSSDSLAALTATDGNFVVGDGTNFVVESGSTARDSIGLGASDTATFSSVNIGSAPAYNLFINSSGLSIGPFASGGQKNIKFGEYATYGGVTIGYTTNAAGTREDLNVGTSGLYFDSNGSASAPLISANADPNTGIYRVGNDNFGFASGGSQVGGFNTDGVYTDRISLTGAGTNYIQAGYTDNNANGQFDPGTDSDHIDFFVGGLNEMRLEADGDLHVDGDVFAASTTVSSDEKLKENIKPIFAPLEILDQIKGVDFNWKKDGSKSSGVIAQDIQKVMPHLVKEGKSLGSDDTHLTVDYNGLIGLLIESVKTLSEKVKELENK